MPLADEDRRRIASLMNRVHRVRDALEQANVTEPALMLEITEADADAIRRSQRYRDTFNYEKHSAMSSTDFWDLRVAQWSPPSDELPPLVTGEWITLHGVRLVWLGKLGWP